jgi:archaellum biogenesis protein FlaJ (TadC family)
MGLGLLELSQPQDKKMIKMKIRLREYTKLMKPTRITLLKFVPILLFTVILLITVGIGLADPTTGLPPVPE